MGKEEIDNLRQQLIAATQPHLVNDLRMKAQARKRLIWIALAAAPLVIFIFCIFLLMAGVRITY